MVYSIHLYEPHRVPMARHIMQMIQEAKVPSVSPVEALRRFQENRDALLLEVRDVAWSTKKPLTTVNMRACHVKISLKKESRIR